MGPRDVGRLLRLSLAPSAAADALAGVVWAHGGRFPLDGRFAWLVVASLGVYHGALALNDWNDREHDARTRPSRPLSTRAIAPGFALALAAVALVGGVLAAWHVSPRAGAWMSGVAALAVAYDLVGRGPWLGPLLLAACRAGNLGCATFAVATLVPGRVAAFAPIVVYGAYVFLVSRLGRMEDGEDAAPLGERPARLVRAIARVPLVLVFVLALPTFANPPGASGPIEPARVVALVGALGLATIASFGLARLASEPAPWTRTRVEASVGACLRRLLLLTAIVALASATGTALDAWIVTGVILCGYPLAHALRRAFPPS